MTPFHLLLAFGMLTSGSLNTITLGFADQQLSVGKLPLASLWSKMNNQYGINHQFDHPFFQCIFMFIGEFLCMVTYLIAKCATGSGHNTDSGGRTKGAFFFAFPAMLDITGTGIMYAGLCLSSASVFQMLRSCSVVFTCALSATILRRTIHPFQWFAVLFIVIGVCMVGYVSVAKNNSDGKSTIVVLFGDVLIILAQLAVAFQMILEEKLLNKYKTPALKVVGLEGTFGFFMLSILLVPMYFIHVDDLPVENVPDALVQMGNNWKIVVALIGNSFSIAFYNFFGISVTKEMSAAHRMVLDSMRTLVVWIVSLLFLGEEFYWLQLGGFVVLSVGTAIYNEIFRLPIQCLYPVQNSQARALRNDGLPESEMSNASVLETLTKDDDGSQLSFVRAGPADASDAVRQGNCNVM